MKAMKFLIIALFAFALNSFGQAGIQRFANDSIKGDTAIMTSTVNVPYAGFVTWDYTLIGKAAGDTIYVDFQGSNNNWTTRQTLSTTTFIQGTTAKDQHLVDDPAEYLRYGLTFRAKLAIDTAAVTNSLFIYRR